MPAQNEKNDHLPVLGVGPAYVIVITVLTVACITLSKLGILPYLRIRATVGVMHTVGTAFLIVGIWLWVSAAIKEKLREKIKQAPAQLWDWGSDKNKWSRLYSR